MVIFNFQFWEKYKFLLFTTIFFVVVIIIANQYYGVSFFRKSSSMDMGNTISYPGFIPQDKGMMGAQPVYDGSMAQESGKAMTVDVSNDTSYAERIVATNHHISLISKNVDDISDKIVDEVGKSGGFVVSSTTDDYQDKTNSYIVARVPADKTTSFINIVKNLSSKVVSENYSASDITDEYKDVQENTRLLEETKSKFETLWKSSSGTQDTLSVLRELQYLQREIDALKGREKYIKEIAQYSLMSISISKDELDLPYTPSESWSAEYIFKQAVRNLVSIFRSLASFIIWAGVFAVIWVPILVLIFLFMKSFRQKQEKSGKSI
jgi:hypothetical protein